MSIDEKPQASTFAMINQLLERDYTVEQIALELNATVKRARALINELHRRKEAGEE